MPWTRYLTGRSSYAAKATSDLVHNRASWVFRRSVSKKANDALDAQIGDHNNKVVDLQGVDPAEASDPR